MVLIRGRATPKTRDKDDMGLKLYRFDVVEIDGEEMEAECFQRTYATDVHSALESVVRDIPGKLKGSFSGAIVEERLIAGKVSDVYQNCFTINVTRKHVSAYIGVTYLRAKGGIVRV